MRNWQVISLIVSTLLYIGAAIHVSYISGLVMWMTESQVEVFDQNIRTADKLFFLSQAVWMLMLCLIGSLVSKDAKKLALACVFKCLFWFSASNLFDELFSRTPQLSSPQEYWWALVGVLDCVLEYKGTTIPKFVLGVFQMLLSKKTWTLKRKKWPRRTG